MYKRYHAAAVDDEGPRLRIKLASTGEAGAAEHPPLVIEASLVRMYSGVAKRLPETEEWDLSGLLVDGQPVSRATVVAWLNAAYQLVDDTDFEQQDDNPACTVDGLYSLLAFADAVDSTRALLKACCTGLQQLQLSARLGEQQVSLKTDGTAYAFDEGELYEQEERFSDFCRTSDAPDAADSEQQAAFWQQVAAQTEPLLWLAYTLQLEPLMQRLHGFLRSTDWYNEAMLTTAPAAVFTPRVLEAAGVAGLPGGKTMLVHSILGEFAQLNKERGVPAVGTLLKPQGLTPSLLQPLKFDAVVQRSGLRMAPGTIVPIELDLFGESTIKLGEQAYPVQLRIGTFPLPP